MWKLKKKKKVYHFVLLVVAGKEYPLKVSSVEISPDPVKRSGNGEITITGVTSK